MNRLTPFLIAVLATAPATAQTWAMITGAVTDPRGAAVGAASVKLTNRSTGGVRQTETNDVGIYVFAAILPGRYDVLVEKRGFQTQVRRDLSLEVQLQSQLDFQLELGQIEESIVVADAAPLLRTDATTGTVIDTRRITELPLNGRNFLQLVSLAPNVSFGFPTAVASGPAGRQGGTRAEQNISIAGQRSELNHFTVDGIENTDVNFNTYIALPSAMGPRIMQWDFSTLKETRVREGHTIQFRFEAFNFPNHPNWGAPGATISAPDFGKVRSTRTAMREIQLGLKYVF